MRLHRAVRFLAFGVLLLVIPAALCSPSAAQIGIGIGISVHIGPPALPVYEQPICPSPGYLWTPGYWAWSDDDGYYWVPGTWVEPPTVGLLWTPGYWGWNNGLYVWNAGYWGPQIGFYGGINYGFGYGGVGFVGGEWRGGAFFYNTAVMHVDTVHITNVYVNRTVIVNNESHVAFNGGEGGVAARPTPQEVAFAREPHTPPVAAQVQQEHAASQNRALFASVNHGAPAIAATAHPGEFSGHGVVAARAGAPYHAPAMSPREARASAPPANRPAASRPFVPPNKSNTPNTRPREENRPATESRPAAHPESAPRSENAHPQGEPKANAPKAKPPKPAPKAPPKEKEEKPK
jgi:WXXGXW repeat (2 copies)